MDIALFQNLTKYPFIYNNEFHNSLELEQNKTCLEKCKEKDCLNLFDNNSHLTEYRCSKSYDNILLIIGNCKMILNGLIFTDNRDVPFGRKEVRKNWIIEKDSILIFIKKIEEIEIHIKNEISKDKEKNFSMFHDFKTTMNIVFSCTQDIISKLPGDTFSNKLENSEKEIKDLYNSLNLITSQLGMMDVIVNPSSITFGTTKEINIYKLFHKISVLFEHLSKKRNIKIELNSDNFIRNSNCYDSIEFIPLILLDNAIKYSVDNSTIKIDISQNYNKVTVKVKNIGPQVVDENCEKIFEKFFRDKNGIEFENKGIGVGLWVAKKILEAHNCNIYYHKDKNATGEVGLNIFEFEIFTI
ncbi:sensor histidine kinase [Flavobacterium sp.]|jgi:K+-sensing histidine kinase KdpD|uniref:sensor histidine kinase n=1 Tax=Flavobacterium sp. TaxID=239 RepID=UPI0037BF462E